MVRFRVRVWVRIRVSVRVILSHFRAKAVIVTEHAALPQVHQVLDLNTDTKVRMNITIL